MADSTRQKIRTEVETRLKAITTANGYNTNYKVYDNVMGAEASIAPVACWVTFGNEEGGIEQLTMLGGQPNVLLVQVHCYLRKKSDIITLQEQALQDLRNKMQTDLKKWKAAAGGADGSTIGATMSGYDTCETDEGILAADGMAFFTQGMVYTYNAGPTW